MRKNRPGALEAACAPFRSGGGPLLALLLLLAGPGLPALAQDDGPANEPALSAVSGRVVDEKDAPLVGARVTLSAQASPKSRPLTGTTGKDGRFRVVGVGPGRWNLTIVTPGYITAHGWVDVPSGAPPAPLAVAMRPNSEVSPGGVEGGNTNTVRMWLEKGNSLLAEGKAAAARGEYQRAVRYLSREEKPQIYRAIARCHFLEGQPAAAVEVLKRALLAEPQDAESRKLLPLVAAQAGQEAAAAEWLARLDREGPDALEAELPMPARRAQPEAPPPPPPEPARAGRVGAYRVVFTERYPGSEVEEVARRWGLSLTDIERVDPTGGHYDLAKESFSVVVPASYRPEKPPGLLVWISPDEDGGLVWPELLPVLEEANLIWVGANQSGNVRPKWTRVGLALDALANLPKLYPLDPGRIYVGGYSGGGRTASTLAFLYPDAVRGTFCMRGVDIYRALPVSDRPGASWPAAFHEPPKAALSELRQHHRFVLLTGEVDFNRAQTKAVARELRAQGFEHITYLETPGASHYTDLVPDVFRQVVTALDGR